MELTSMIIPILGIIVYSGSAYFKNFASGEVKIYWPKLIATVVVGLIIGIASLTSGVEVTSEFIAAQIFTYTGSIVFVENIIKGIIRYFNPGWLQDPRQKAEKHLQSQSHWDLIHEGYSALQSLWQGLQYPPC